MNRKERLKLWEKRHANIPPLAKKNEWWNEHYDKPYVFEYPRDMGRNLFGCPECGRHFERDDPCPIEFVVCPDCGCPETETLR